MWRLFQRSAPVATSVWDGSQAPVSSAAAMVLGGLIRHVAPKSKAQGKTTPRDGKIVEDLAEPEISLRKHFFGQHAGFVDEKSGYGAPSCLKCISLMSQDLGSCAGVSDVERQSKTRMQSLAPDEF